MSLNNFFLFNMDLEKYFIFLILYVIILFSISYIINILFIRYKLLDIPNERKSHIKPTPISGGTILVISTIFAYLFLKYITKMNLDFYDNLVFISIIFFLLGLFDDIKNPKAVVKIFLILILLFISLLKYNSLIINELRFLHLANLNITLGYFSIPFTIFCIFMFFNALNYSDGKNGISISYSIFILIFISLLNDNIKIFLFSLILSLLVVLFLNLKDKLFLGNNGVNFLSIFLSFFIIKTYNLNQNNFFCDEIFLLMLIPGLDASRVTVLRIYKKISPFAPDKRHLHHYLSKFISNDYIWFFYLLLCTMPIVIEKISSNFSVALAVPIIIYIFLILRFSKQ